MSELQTYNTRQLVLFSLTSFSAVPHSETKHFLPETEVSPFVTYKSNQLPEKMIQKRIRRFKFDSESGFLFLGGYVKCLSWSPPEMLDKTAPCYLAAATFPSLTHRPNVGDPVNQLPGLIQIWKCTNLLLSKSSDPQIQPHFFLAHDWGTVMDIQWIPIAVWTAGKSNPCCCLSNDLINVNLTSVSNKVPSLIGHLIVASSDGFVRIFAVPSKEKCDYLRKSLKPAKCLHLIENNEMLIYKVNPTGVMRLAPATDIPPWLGWPLTMTIRDDFPDRLGVGYTSGHLAVFCLSTLDPYFTNFSQNLMRPVFIVKILPGPFTSLAFHPLQHNIIAGLGYDREVHIWNLDDIIAVQSGMTELFWQTGHSGIGGIVIWPRSAAKLWIGRQEYISEHIVPDRTVTQVYKVKSSKDIPLRLKSFTACYPLCAPLDCCRWYIDMGLTSTTSMSYSDSLAYLVHGNSGGRIQFVSMPLETYSGFRVKTRLFFQPNWIYQWIMRPLSDKHISMVKKSSSMEENFHPEFHLDANVSPAQEVVQFKDSNDFNELLKPEIEKPLDENLAKPCNVCNSGGNLLCWHKVYNHFQFVLQDDYNLPEAKYNFLEAPFLSISKLAVCPIPNSSTWIAVGTAFGFIQFICADQFSDPDMDIALGNKPSEAVQRSVYANPLARTKKKLGRPRKKLIEDIKPEKMSYDDDNRKDCTK